MGGPDPRQPFVNGTRAINLEEAELVGHQEGKEFEKISFSFTPSALPGI
jgi:hypothetical protein